MSNIGIIGSGAMGTGIAQAAAAAGEDVILFDTHKPALEKAKSNLDSILKKLAEKGKNFAAEAKDISSRIHFAGELSEFKNCNLVIEAVIEDLTIKRNLFSELEKIVSADCVLGTNTSSLSITSI